MCVKQHKIHLLQNSEKIENLVTKMLHFFFNLHFHNDQCVPPSDKRIVESKPSSIGGHRDSKNITFGYLHTFDDFGS